MVMQVPPVFSSWKRVPKRSARAAQISL